MNARPIWCIRIDCGYEYQTCGEIPSECPGCKKLTGWRSWPSARSPVVTENDRTFLKSLRIAAD